VSLWKIIKLELGPTGEFPKGSPGRCYILRLPLSSDGAIDAAECAAHPRQATVRRFWPNEADQSGHIVRKDGGWAFSYVSAEEAEGGKLRFEDKRLAPGGCLAITEFSGEELPFRVVSVQPV
jgi:hypothetical protein